MSKRLEDLRPEVVEKARAFLSTMEAIGDRAVVTSTFRSDVEQLAMYAQGRAQLDVVNALRKMCGMRSLAKSENGYTISNCDGQTTKSKHQTGEAFDVVLLSKTDGKPVWIIVGDAIERYKTLGAIGKAHGLTWGGDFRPLNAKTGLGWDPFHFET